VSHADASSVVSAGSGMLVAVSELLIAQIARPARFASALPRSFTGTVHASGIGHAFGAVGARPADAASARARSPTAAVFPTASLRADRCSHDHFIALYVYDVSLYV